MGWWRVSRTSAAVVMVVMWWGEMVTYLSALKLLSRALARSAGARGLVMV